MSQNNDFFAPVKALGSLLDISLGLLGVSFMLLLGWDAYKSQSNLPESTWYTFRRTPPAYPAEIDHDVRIQEATYRDELQKKVEELEAELEESKTRAYADLRRELENSKTGCISLANIPNAVCIGPRQTAQSP